VYLKAHKNNTVEVHKSHEVKF